MDTINRTSLCLMEFRIHVVSLLGGEWALSVYIRFIFQKHHLGDSFTCSRIKLFPFSKLFSSLNIEVFLLYLRIEVCTDQNILTPDFSVNSKLTHPPTNLFTQIFNMLRRHVFTWSFDIETKYPPTKYPWQKPKWSKILIFENHNNNTPVVITTWIQIK